VGAGGRRLRGTAVVRTLHIRPIRMNQTLHCRMCVCRRLVAGHSTPRVNSLTSTVLQRCIHPSPAAAGGDAKSSLGDAKSSLGDATSSLGDAESSLGDAKSSLGDAESSLRDVYSGAAAAGFRP
jgi:hypothetical protein